MKAWRYINVALGIVNIALFCLWWSLIKIDSTTKTDPSGYLLSYIGTQITILGVVIGVAALTLAALGFIGFQTVLERAEAMADRTAREVVANLNADGDLKPETKKPHQSGKLPDVGTVRKAKD